MPQPDLSLSTSTSDPSRDPVPPPVSPITPTLAPARLPDATPQQPLPSPAARPIFTHSQPDQLVIPPPPPEPIDFDSNPDAIALRSAISVLQVQKRRATADIQALGRAKDDALADPDGFIRHLAAGKVHARGDAPRRSADDDDDDDDDGNSEEWSSLPRPQDVVRCPPINWAQYAVVGSSLDKLHAEQVSRPTQGTPAAVGADGMYEFKGDGKQEKYLGATAPYMPGKDRIERKPKGKK